MKQAKLIWVMGVFLAGFATVSASLQLGVATDKSVYQLEETVQVFVSVYNPTANAIIMEVGNPTATYLMDNIYFWHQNKNFPQMVLPPITIQPGQTLSWQLEHGITEQAEYPLLTGVHFVKGTIYSNQTIGQYSEPIEFQVIPEPMTISLLAFGFLQLRKKK